MKLSLQLTAPLLLVASLTSPTLAASGPSRTIQIRNDKVVLPPAGSWSKAGPLVRRNHSVLRRAIPFGKVDAPLLVRAVVEERGDDDEDVEFVDCSDYDPNEEDDDDDEEESQGQVGTVAGGSASTPSSSSSQAAWTPSPSASDAPAPASPSPAPISIDWSQFQNPKIVSPAEGALSLVTPHAAPQASPGSSSDALKKEKTEVDSAPAASAADTKATANPDNIAPQTLTVEKGCIRYHTVVPGEVCLGVLDGSKDLGLTLDQFYAYNPVLDSTCSNLQVGWAVCTGKSS